MRKNGTGGDAFARQARICRIFTHPDRLRIVHALCKGEKCVSGIAKGIRISQPKLSQHLGLMRRLGVLATRRAGTTIYYRLSNPRIADACRTVKRIMEDVTSKKSPCCGGRGEAVARAAGSGAEL